MTKTLALVFSLLGFAGPATAQSDAVGTQTMRPVVRGRRAAVSSMRAPATEAARRILEAGGNAFDAAVAGQAVLGLTDFPITGLAVTLSCRCT
jgi:gamma-glutamyltranspeptidase